MFHPSSHSTGWLCKWNDDGRLLTLDLRALLSGHASHLASASSAAGSTGEGGGTTFEVVSSTGDGAPQPGDAPSAEGGGSDGSGGGGSASWLWLGLLVVLVGAGTAGALMLDDIPGGDGVAALFGGTGDQYKDWQVLEVELSSTTTSDGTRFAFDLTAFDDQDKEIPASAIEHPGNVSYLLAGEPIEPPATGDPRWTTCSPEGCTFEVQGQPHVYARWARPSGEPSLGGEGLWMNIWVNRTNGTQQHWTPPGRWDFQEAWTGSHTWTVAKAIKVETIPLSKLDFELRDGTYVNESCDSVIPSRDEGCFRTQVEVTSTAEKAGRPTSLSWEATYRDQEPRGLPFVDRPDELEPDASTTLVVGIPAKPGDEPQTLSIRSGNETQTPVELDVSEAWQESRP